MEINTKFKPGDQVCIIHEAVSFVPCTFCGEAGIVDSVHTGESIACPACRGKKRRRGTDIQFVATDLCMVHSVTATLSRVSFEDQIDCEILYEVSGRLSVPEDNIFLRLDEAQTECGRRNRECNSPLSST